MRREIFVPKKDEVGSGACYVMMNFIFVGYCHGSTAWETRRGRGGCFRILLREIGCEGGCELNWLRILFIGRLWC